MTRSFFKKETRHNAKDAENKEAPNAPTVHLTAKKLKKRKTSALFRLSALLPCQRFFPCRHKMYLVGPPHCTWGKQLPATRYITVYRWQLAT